MKKSHNLVHSLRDHVAGETEHYEPGSDAPEPGEVVLVRLSRDPNVHPPQARDDVHGQDNGTQDRKLAEDVGRLLCTLVHADVDLGEIVLV